MGPEISVSRIKCEDDRRVLPERLHQSFLSRQWATGTALALSTDVGRCNSIGIEIKETKYVKKLLFSIPFLCLAAVLAAGCTATKNAGVAVGQGTKEAAQQVSNTTTDASITAAIKMKMADDPAVSADKINVDTSDGKVTLNGTVQNAAEADKAIGLARSVDGVKSVESNLVVRR